MIFFAEYTSNGVFVYWFPTPMIAASRLSNFTASGLFSERKSDSDVCMVRYPYPYYKSWQGPSPCQKLSSFDTFLIFSIIPEINRPINVSSCASFDLRRVWAFTQVLT